MGGYYPKSSKIWRDTVRSQYNREISVEVKKCSNCKEEKSSFEFAADKRSLTGLQSKCKSCYQEYYIKNKQRLNKRSAQYKKNRSDLHCAQQAGRRARKSNSTPSWITKEQKKQIEDFYWLAKDLYAVSGQKYHVDHIVPLQGENISGLHVPWNLQVLPDDLNLTKGNKHA